MPIYEYLCRAATSRSSGLPASEKPTCPACGKQKVIKQISVPVAPHESEHAAMPGQVGRHVRHLDVPAAAAALAQASNTAPQSPLRAGPCRRFSFGTHYGITATRRPTHQPPQGRSNADRQRIEHIGAQLPGH